MKLARYALFAAATAVLVGGVARAADKDKAKKALHEAVQSQNAEGITKACDELIELGGKDAVNIVVKEAASGVDGSIYWQLTGGAAGFKDNEALTELGHIIIARQNDKSGVARDLLFQLKNNNSEYACVPVSLVLEKGKFDLQLMAADQLAETRTVDSVSALIAGLKREEKGDPQLRARITAGLINLTGENMGDSANWEGWWKENKSKGVPPKKQTGGGSTVEREREKTITESEPKRVIVLACDSPDSKAETNDFDYDHMQEILASNKIPHMVVKRKDFSDNPQKYLGDAYAILINCHQINEFCICPDCQGGGGGTTNRLIGCNPKCNKHIKVCYALPRSALDAIKAWVESGGYLYTEDWGLVETIEKLWPEKLGSVPGAARLVRQPKNPGPGYEAHIDVKLTPGKGETTHPFLRGVWMKPKSDSAVPAGGDSGGGTVSKVESPAKPMEHEWQVDDESPSVGIKDTAEVTPLLVSTDLGKFTDGNMAVAVTFRVGNGGPPPKPKVATGPDSGKERGTGDWGTHTKGGRVLHTMSHFGHQSSSSDGQALYNLILNFLSEAIKKHQG